VVHPFLAFAVFAAVVTVTPGADTMLVVRTAAVSGRRAGLAAVAGIALGCLVWAALSALGVTAVLTASRLAFEVLRAAGVAYLVWLGLRALWHARRPAGLSEASSAALSSAASGASAASGMAASGATVAPGASAWRAWRTGLLTNLLNPKVGAFYLSVMPAFLPTGVPALAGALGLAGIHVIEGVVWLSLLVAIVGRARAWLSRPAVTRRLEQLTGLVFIGFGVRLAFERSPA
jgi:threonine/homoserine/homoserine lactone efflux protein